MNHQNVEGFCMEDGIMEGQKEKKEQNKRKEEKRREKEEKEKRNRRRSRASAMRRAIGDQKFSRRTTAPAQGRAGVPKPLRRTDGIFVSSTEKSSLIARFGA